VYNLLYLKLQSYGFKPWLDKIDLIPGQNWQIEIPEAIRKSDIFIACLSRISVQKQGYIQKEFRLALDTYAQKPPGSIYLIPVKLNGCEIPDYQMPEFGVSLRDIQWIELGQEDGFERLVRAVEYAIGTGKLIESNLKIFEKTTNGEKLKIETNSRYITIGRSPKSDVLLEDKTISWEHGYILLIENEYFYRHVSKTNPTYIKRHHEEILLRQDITTEIRLKNNDRISIGNNVLIIQFNLFADFNGYTTTQEEDS